MIPRPLSTRLALALLLCLLAAAAQNMKKIALTLARNQAPKPA